MNAGGWSRGKSGVSGARPAGGSTSGIGAPSSTGPGHGFDQAPSAIPSSLPSCSSRALTEVSERPARSTPARTVTGPSAGDPEEVHRRRAGAALGVVDRELHPAHTIAIT